MGFRFLFRSGIDGFHNLLSEDVDGRLEWTFEPVTRELVPEVPEDNNPLLVREEGVVLDMLDSP